MDLINIFNEYRNGNKTVIDKLFTSKDNFNRKGGYTGTDVIITDTGLDLLAYRIYEHYRKKAKFIPKHDGIAKYSEQPYFGTLNDVKMEIYIVLNLLVKLNSSLKSCCYKYRPLLTDKFILI